VKGKHLAETLFGEGRGTGICFHGTTKLYVRKIGGEKKGEWEGFGGLIKKKPDERDLVFLKPRIRRAPQSILEKLSKKRGVGGRGERKKSIVK